MANPKIQLRRGKAADLPTGGTIEGEPRFTTDTGQLYIDNGTSNVLIGGTNNTYEVNALVTYGSGSVYTDATITSALTALGTSTKATLLLSPGTWVFDENIDYSSYTNITFKIPPGAIISHGAYTLNIPNIEAGLYQIFTGAGAVTLSGAIGPIYPQWWGAVGDDSTDNTTALQAFINCLEAAYVAHGYIPVGNYKHTGLTITKAIKLSCGGGLLSYLAGTTGGAVLINTHATNDALTITAGDTVIYGLVIEDLVVKSDGTGTGDGIVVNGQGLMDFNRLIVKSNGGNGFKLADADHATGINIRNCFIYYNSGNGIYGRTISTQQLNAINIQNNLLQENALSGINIWGTEINIEHNIIQGNTGPGITISGEDLATDSTCSVVNVKNNYFEANKGGDILGEVSYHSSPARARAVYSLIIEDNYFNTSASQVTAGVTGVMMFRYNTTYTAYQGFYRCRIGRNRITSDLSYVDFDPLATGVGAFGYMSTLLVELTNGTALSTYYNQAEGNVTIEETRIRKTAGYPTITPDFVNQKYFDTTNKRHWIATGSASAADWKPITRSLQGAPTAKTTSATLTIAELLTGIITGTHTAGSTQTYTLPTGALADASLYFGTNDYLDWSLINLSAEAADTITVAGDTGHTIVGNTIVQSAHSTTGGIYGSSGMFRTRKTAANTFITYRIN